MQRYLRKIKKKVSPLYAFVGVMLLVVIVLIIVTSGGGGDDDKAATTDTKTSTEKDSTPKPRKRKRRPKQAPVGTTGVIDQARREGAFVVAQARATVKSPGRVSLRVSAAPKQRVTVNWQLSCFKNRQVAVGKGDYKTKTPDERQIQLPIQGAETCIATAGAQLTRHGNGRVKVAIVGG